MDALNKLLDKAKVICSIPTDMALAEKIGVTRAAVSGWRNSRHLPDEVACARIAEMTGEPLARVLGVVGEARAVSRDAKEVWRRLASAAAIVLAVSMAALPSPATANEGGSDRVQNQYYVN